MNLWFIWIILGIIFLIIEIFTPAFVASIIGIACFVSGGVALITPKSIFPYDILIQISSFSIALVLAMFFLRPIFLKYFTGKKSRDSNIDALINKEVLVEEDIDNLAGKGYIKIGADYFPTRSIGNEKIAKGMLVIIKKFEGNTALVELKNK